MAPSSWRPRAEEDHARAVFTDVTVPHAFDSIERIDDLEILGSAEGKASAVNVLGIACFGDASIASAARDAVGRAGGTSWWT